MLPCSFHTDRQSEQYAWQCLHVTSVDNSAQCPAVVMLPVKTPVISLSSPHVIPRPGCCALDHSYLTDGRKWPVLLNCVQIKELRCDEAFVLISVHRGAEFQTAVKHRIFKKKFLSCLSYMTVAHVNKVKIFDYFISFDVSNILILKINKQLVIINIIVKTELAVSHNSGAHIPLSFDKYRKSYFLSKTQNAIITCRNIWKTCLVSTPVQNYRRRLFWEQRPPWGR
jgi:hypothetical protein